MEVAGLALAALGIVVTIVLGVLALRRRRERPSDGEPDGTEHPPVAVPPALTPPPPDPDFVGRKGELDKAVAVLVGDEPLGICGGPGIGKSTLAKELAHDARIVAHFPDGILWIASEGLALDRICETIGTALGTTDVAAQPTTERKLAALRTLLAGARRLIILDNADEPAAARRFAQDVHAFPLITSRERVTGVESRSIDPLQDDEAVKLLAAKAKRAGRALALAERNLLPQIATMLENHPLALVLAGGQLPDMTAQDLVAGLSASRLDHLIDPTDPNRSVRRSFETSYDRLSAEDARLFAVLGVFGGTDFSLEAVQAVDETATAQRLGLLVQRSLVRYSDGRYSLHLLLRDYAQEKLADDQAPYHRAAAYYARFALDHRQVEREHLAALDRELTNILAAMDWCQEHEQWEMVTAFARLLDDYLDVRGLWTELLERALLGAEAAGKASDRRERAACLHSAGIANQKRGDYREAKRLYQETLAIAEELGDRSGIAASKHQLGMIAQDTGDYQEARRLYQESLAIAEELGDRSGIARSKGQLGTIAQLSGDCQEARRLYQESLAIAEELGDRSGIAISKHQLGRIAQLSGDYQEARRFYQESLAMKQELGNKHGIAISKGALGSLAEATGDVAAAKQLYEQALAILEQIGAPEAETARQSLERLAKRGQR